MATVVAIGETENYIATFHICSSKRGKLCSLIEKELFRLIYALNLDISLWCFTLVFHSILLVLTLPMD